MPFSPDCYSKNPTIYPENSRFQKNINKDNFFLHDIKLLVILSVLKSVASLLFIKKRDNLKKKFYKKICRFEGFVCVCIYINVQDIKRVFPNRKNINGILQVVVQSDLEYWKCKICLLFRD